MKRLVVVDKMMRCLWRIVTEYRINRLVIDFLCGRFIKFILFQIFQPSMDGIDIVVFAWTFNNIDWLRQMREFKVFALLAQEYMFVGRIIDWFELVLACITNQISENGKYCRRRADGVLLRPRPLIYLQFFFQKSFHHRATLCERLILFIACNQEWHRTNVWIC